MVEKNSSRTGDTEGFFRRSWTGNNHRPGTQIEEGVNSAPPPLPSSSIHPGVRSFSAPIQNGMDRLPVAPNGIKPGSLRAPGELGVVRNSESTDRADSSEEEAEANPFVRTHPNVLRMHQRENDLIRASRTPASIAAQTQALRELAKRYPTPTYSASFCYRGMEVLVATTSLPTCYLMFARTRFVFQTLQVDTNFAIVALTIHPTSGQIVLAQKDGSVRSYDPESTDPLVENYGPYRWRDGHAFSCVDFFSTENDSMQITDASVDPAHSIALSLSDDCKLLVGHHDQIAVFDVASKNSKSKKHRKTVECLWTTRLPKRVLLAQLSGDGHAIALVLDHNSSFNTTGSLDGTDNADADGVYTFERDFDDGGSLSSFGPVSVDDVPSVVSLASSPTVGILYRPGPYIVLPSPVVRLSFRGFGHLTSEITRDPKIRPAGNDLLLTSCSDGVAKIFSQYEWQELVSWETPPSTRVDWVRNITALTLGDLDSSTPSKARSARSSRRPSTTSLVDLDEEAGHETLGKRNHFSSIPSHTTPSSHAGAWVSELTFQGAFPALRISRLTYLKRSLSDWKPTLLESISAFLPPDSVLKDRVLHTSDVGLTVEGVWPAWSPWAATAEPSSNAGDALGGSAMESLGLSSGPRTQGGGFFCDNFLGGAQTPPIELRITALHPVSGQVVVMEIPVFGDQTLNTVEMGSPIRSVVSVLDLDLRSKQEVTPSASTDNAANRIVARLEEATNIISLTLRQPGTMSLLPDTWSREDANPKVAGHLLNNPTKLRDESLVSVPLALPPFQLPKDDGVVTALRWWPSNAFSGTSVVLAFTSAGTIVAIKIPPTWSFLEPPMPGCDESIPSIVGNKSSMWEDDPDFRMEDYEVSIVPEAEYGLGLRLESHVHGMTAIAGSFKRHPLNGEMLPAERTGMITLGDELLSANGISLSEKSFEEIISAVREIGANANIRHPVRMKFRRRPLNTRRRAGSQTSETSGRRTMNEMIGVTPEELERNPVFNRGSAQTTDRSQNGSEKNWNPTNMYGSIAVCTVFRNLGLWETPDDVSRMVILPLNSNRDTIHAHQEAILFSISGTHVLATALSLSQDLDQMASPAEKLGSCRIGDQILTNITTADASSSSVSLVVVDSAGMVRLLVVSITPKESTHWTISFHTFDLFKTEIRRTTNLIVRACSVQLIAVSSSEDENEIAVWSARPHPGCLLEKGGGKEHVQDISWDYFVFLLRVSPNSVGTTSDKTKIIDFSFLRSGFLDASPSLICYSGKSVSIYQRCGGGRDWEQRTEIYYSNSPTSSSTTMTASAFGSTAPFGVYSNPLDVFPHILPALQCAFASSDESTFLRSDWHPDSFLAEICLDDRGVKAALDDRLRSLFLWLSSVGKDLSDEDLEGPLRVAPLLIVEENFSEDSDGQDQPRARLTLLTGPATDQTLPSQNVAREVSKLKSFRDILLCSINQAIPESSSTVQSLDCDLGIKKEELPPLLRTLSSEDLEIIWALYDMLVKPPCFDKLDKLGQLFLFTREIFHRLAAITNKIESSISTRIPMPSMHVKITSKSGGSQSCEETYVASSGCLAALMSRSQNKILDCCRANGHKFDWPFARDLRIAFWLRSDRELAKISEEIGQTLYRAKKEIMECALFFVIARKTRTLRNLAAADSTDSGRKLFQFLTSHDFSDERGRRAAEKNAYSLLRKNRYGIASAFFLLAEPPFLKSALEVIVTKMRDSDLAFAVARLTESSVAALQPSLNASSVGLGGILGGGGGYAIPPGSDSSLDGEDGERFDDWQPDLGMYSKKLLVERLLPQAERDNALSAIQLLWLGKIEEASWWLSGFIEPSHDSDTGYRLVNDIDHRVFGTRTDAKRQCAGSMKLSNAIGKVNLLVDFISAPLLLDALGGSQRAQFASCLAVSSALIARGVEMPTIRSLLHLAGSQMLLKHPITCLSPREDAKHGLSPSSAAVKPSISKSLSSSLQPKRSCNLAVAASSGVMSSSVFDSFDTPPTHNSKAKVSDHFERSETVQSSIFDAFDAPPTQNSNPKVSTQEGRSYGMQSSIFDSFDPPPLQNISVTAGRDETSGNIESSIFDSFDVHPGPTVKGSACDDRSGDVRCTAISFDDTRQLFSENDAQESKVLCPVDNRPTIDNQEAIKKSEIAISLSICRKGIPDLWSEWRYNMLLLCAGRRLLREVASVVAQFHGDPRPQSMVSFYHSEHPLVPSRASEVLQLRCDSEKIIGRVKRSLEQLSTASGLETLVVVSCSVQLLGHSQQRRRTLFTVILYAAAQQDDMADLIVRAAASDLIQMAKSMVFCNDVFVLKQKSRSHASTQHIRRLAARLSWQLEICMWLQRGGGLYLSASTIKDAIAAVRVGILIASWNRNTECLEAMIRNQPDCSLDDEAVHPLWTNLKSFTAPEREVKKNRKISSGGWEFLVDCRRTEATKMLRCRPTGCFIMRPHPNDHGVFTLSFKTNLASEEGMPKDGEQQLSDHGELVNRPEQPSSTVMSSRASKRDDIVQHAVVRLSESGFRCGSFGPFASLIGLLEAVSASLPFNLRFDQPPVDRVIREGFQPSPNAVFFRKLALSHADSGAYPQPAKVQSCQVPSSPKEERTSSTFRTGSEDTRSEKKISFAYFLELTTLSKIHRQLSAVVSVHVDEAHQSDGEVMTTDESYEAASDSVLSLMTFHGVSTPYASSRRLLSPLICWGRSLEILSVEYVAPELNGSFDPRLPVDFEESAEAIEIFQHESATTVEQGDAVLRQMIKRGSGVDFSTLRLSDGGDCTMVVVFGKKEGIEWLLSSGLEASETGALRRLKIMEHENIIEPIEMQRLPLKHKVPEHGESDVRYRIVDPWEVEALPNREGETRGASLGRESFSRFSIGQVALSSESTLRDIGGHSLLELWTSTKGGVLLTKALASIDTPWERAGAGDLLPGNGIMTSVPPYLNSIRQHLYRNALFRRLDLPQRFVALMQVELLDLKNLSSPGGSVSLSTYALLRLKRDGNRAGLTNKTRTLDTAKTHATKLGKSSGPNAPASWGSVVRFRFPLPEDVSVEGSSLDDDRETLFKGPPCVLQITVYEKKLIVDNSLGTADIRTDGLWSGGQLEEWVPLRSDKQTITWFARIRLTLRYELMCHACDAVSMDTISGTSSVGLRRMEELIRAGASAHEDNKQATSSPDLLTYFESMVY